MDTRLRAQQLSSNVMLCLFQLAGTIPRRQRFFSKIFIDWNQQITIQMFSSSLSFDEWDRRRLSLRQRIFVLLCSLCNAITKSSVLKTIKNFSRVFNWHWTEQHHLEELWAFLCRLFFSSYCVGFEAGGNGNTGPDEKLHDIVRWKYRCWLADAFHAWSTAKPTGRVIGDGMKRSRAFVLC